MIATTQSNGHDLIWIFEVRILDIDNLSDVPDLGREEAISGPSELATVTSFLRRSAHPGSRLPVLPHVRWLPIGFATLSAVLHFSLSLHLLFSYGTKIAARIDGFRVMLVYIERGKPCASGDCGQELGQVQSGR
ncbi:hypothetical protein V6N13_000269 [Hibiscus sabdariffa]